MGDKNWCCLLVSIVAMFSCLMLSNYQIESILKKQFTNNLTHFSQPFTSPLSIIFFVSGMIWLFGSIYRCCTHPQNCIDKYDQVQMIDDERIIQLQFDRINFQKTQQKHQKSQDKEKNNTQPQQLVFDNLPKLQILKIVVPNSLELLCFFYGIVYLSFPKVMIFKIVSRLGLITLYESLFTEEPNKCLKFIISVLTFLGFGIFNYSFLDSPNIEKDQRLYKENIVYGYMFVIGMCYLGLVRKIFEKQMNQKYGNWTGKRFIVTQAKTNCILAYLLLIYLKQEIYGSVFAVLHYEFLFGVLGLTFLLYVGILLKTYITNKFMPVLGNFICILQKNMSLIVSVIVFGQGINSGQIVGVCVIAVMAFLYFLLGFRQLNETKEIQSKQNDFKESTTFRKIIFQN